LRIVWRAWVLLRARIHELCPHWRSIAPGWWSGSATAKLLKTCLVLAV